MNQFHKIINTFLKYSIITCSFLLLQLVACTISKKAGNTQPDFKTNEEGMKLEFDILSSEIGPFNDMKIREYFLEYELLASIKQINTSDTTMMLFYSNFFIDENYEIIDLNKEHQDSLRGEYHYSILFNTDYDLIKPNEFLIDTFNISREFFFYKSKPDTFQIRVKRRYDQDMIYSNWDTLIVR